MPTTNVLLQLFKGGWREQTAVVVTDNLRIEALLGSGAVEREPEAERIATAQLELYANPIIERTVAVEPVNFADTPWLSHVPGETIDLDTQDQLVESLSYKRDDDGHLDYAAEIGTHIDTPEERTALAMKKMSNGTIGGTSKVAQPVATTTGEDTLAADPVGLSLSSVQLWGGPNQTIPVNTSDVVGPFDTRNDTGLGSTWVLAEEGGTGTGLWRLFVPPGVYYVAFRYYAELTSALIAGEDLRITTYLLGNGAVTFGAQEARLAFGDTAVTDVMAAVSAPMYIEAGDNISWAVSSEGPAGAPDIEVIAASVHVHQISVGETFYTI